MSARPLAFCYVTDDTYALPTLVAAVRLRNQVASTLADVYIITFGVQPLHAEALREFANSHGILVLQLDGARQLFSSSRFEDSYISMAAMGRYFMTEVLPASYDNLVYIDGDTWTTPDITAIAEVLPRRGSLAAVEDGLISYAKHDIGPYGSWVRRYFRSLGLPLSHRYVNSGVLIGSTETWKDVGADALRYYFDNTDACIHPDQSSLNAVVGDRLTVLSPRWNFTTQLMYFGVEEMVRPAIYHFTGPSKPWMGQFAPWTAISKLYQAELGSYSGLNLPLRRMSDAEAAFATNNCNRVMRTLRTLKRARLTSRRRAVKAAMQEEALRTGQTRVHKSHSVSRHSGSKA